MFFNFVLENLELFSLIAILVCGCMFQLLYHSFNIDGKFHFRKFITTFLLTAFTGTLLMVLVREMYMATALYSQPIMKVLSGTIGLLGYNVSSKILFKFLFKTLDENGVDVETETPKDLYNKDEHIDRLLKHRLFENLVLWSSLKLQSIRSADIYDEDEKKKREFLARTVIEIRFNILLKKLKSLTVYFCELYKKDDDKKIEDILDEVYWVKFFKEVREDFNMLCKKQGVNDEFLYLFTSYYNPMEQSILAEILSSLNNSFYDSPAETYNSILDLWGFSCTSVINQMDFILKLNGKLSRILKKYEIPLDK